MAAGYSTAPFSVVASAWKSKLKQAEDFKNKRFGPEAAEGVRFLAGPYDFYFNQIRNDKFFRMGSQQSQSGIVVTCNKVAELVQIFGPVLYHRNPTRRVTPRQFPEIDPQIFVMDPMSMMMVQQIYQKMVMDQQTDKVIGQLFESILNKSPEINDLKSNARRAIDESIIKGLGVLWHDIAVCPATGRRTPGSFWRSVDDLLLDPEADSIDTVKWISRSTWMPTWEAERRWRLMPGTLKGEAVSSASMAATAASAAMPGDGIQRDLVRVFEIWSKMGVGGRLEQCHGAPIENRVAYEAMGDYCYLAIAEQHHCPLNLPPEMFTQPDAWQQAQRAVQWPTPFWADRAWPCTFIYFHEVPKDPWPLSHLTPGMGELKFLNWAYSKMAAKIGITCRDFIAISDQLSDELKSQIESGADLTVLKMVGMEGKKLSELIEFIQHPTWNPDMWRVLDSITQAFDLRVGLTELMYGLSSRQMRSAEESARKFEQVNVRPDDMANKVEDSMSAAARREMLAARWHCDPQDIQSLSGPLAAMAWQSLVYAQPIQRIFDLHARIESDSTKKPNASLLIDGIEKAMQMLVQPFAQWAGMGAPGPFNALVTDWAKANKLPDPQRYTFIPPPPPPEPQGPTEEDKQREHEERMQDEDHKHDEKMAKKKAKAA